MSETSRTSNHVGSLDCPGMLSILHSWAQAGWIRWLDVELAEFIHEVVQEQANTEVASLSPLLLLGAALCSHQNGHGHACLDLQHCLQTPEKTLSLPPEHAVLTPDITPLGLLSGISLEQWQAACRYPLVCAEVSAAAAGGRADNISNNPSVSTPLVLFTDQHSSRLYLRRYWHYEMQLKTTIHNKLRTRYDIDEEQLKHTLDRLFAGHTSVTPDWQRIACALSARSQLSVITGGPGTGKTTTVVKLLSLLQALQQPSSAQARSALAAAAASALRIKLAAPTGKAAARLSASIAVQLAQLTDTHHIPREVSTLHRLLGPIRHSRFFKHNAANPLPADVVVVDEASMVDIELMAHLMDALPDHCRLILLGDKDQLASVEAGAVLGSLCEQANEGHYHQSTADWVLRVSGQQIPHEKIDNNGRLIDQSITMLHYSHRFGAVPGIGALADAVNRGASSQLSEIFSGYRHELRWIRANSITDRAFESMICDPDNGYGYYLSSLRQPPAADASAETRDAWADQILTAHTRFQLLAAVRKGELGVEELNVRIRAILTRNAYINNNATVAATSNTSPHEQAHKSTHDSVQNHEWYAGRPVMITRNDYSLQLMNGDIGIALPWNAGHGETTLRVAFRDVQNPTRIRWILPARLQEIETVFAMTVHKSQGSEFTHTAMILPAYDSPILTRELIYTAITRASQQFTLICSNTSVLQQAVQSRVLRASGLASSLD